LVQGDVGKDKIIRGNIGTIKNKTCGIS
jgi:hypothetical protein